MQRISRSKNHFKFLLKLTSVLECIYETEENNILQCKNKIGGLGGGDEHDKKKKLKNFNRKSYKNSGTFKKLYSYQNCHPKN